MSGRDLGTTPGDGEDPYPYVAVSEIAVSPAGGPDLEDAFRRRLGKVDGWPGFGRLEVWRDQRDPSRYVMVSWWSSAEAFRAYMRSAEHRESHSRIPRGQHRPRAAGFRRYEVVAR